ncbi:MAG: hypothetical protein AAF226_19750, partial [Verrucomicrobiota bacterium]
MRKRHIVYLLLGALVIGLGEWDLNRGNQRLFKPLDDFWLDLCVGNAGGGLEPPAVTTVRVHDDYEPISEIFAEAGAENVDPDVASKELGRLDYATVMSFLSENFDPKQIAFTPVTRFDAPLVTNGTSMELLEAAVTPLP